MCITCSYIVPLMQSTWPVSLPNTLQLGLLASDGTCYVTVFTRYEAIMLEKLSITLLSSAPKLTYYAFIK